MKHFRFLPLVFVAVVCGVLVNSRVVHAEADCTDAFTTQCANNSPNPGSTQSSSCDSSGRLFIPMGGGKAGTLSSLGTLTGGMTGVMHCGGPTGLYCCALNDSERCDKTPGYGTGEFDIQCYSAATCATTDSCMLGGKAYTSYDGKACAVGYVCCQKLTDSLRKTGCVATPPGGASTSTYSETACNTVGGLCGSTCASFETASPSVNCGEKGGVAYACCLAKNSCTDGGGYCADSCATGDGSNSDTSCVSSSGAPQTCCKPVATSAAASAAAAKAGAGGSGSASGTSSGAYGTLSAPSSGAYKPPITGNVNAIVANVIKKIIPLIGGVMLLMFFYGGLLWMTAAGDAKAVTKAKSVLTSSVIGMLIITLAYVLANALVNIISGSLSV